jgi:hypothetical protein
LIGETCLDKHRPEPNELREVFVVLHEIRSKSAGVRPSLESEVAVLPSSSIDANSEDEETHYGDDLDQCKPELNLTVERDWQEV